MSDQVVTKAECHHIQTILSHSEVKLMPALGTWTQLVPHAPRNNGTVSSGARALPTGFSSVTVRIDCQTGNAGALFTGFSPAFSNPSMSITFTTYFSWDGGVTFPENATAVIVGSPTGWLDRLGDQISPTFFRGIPFNSALGGAPTHYKADLTVAGGPIDFGISLMES